MQSKPDGDRKILWDKFKVVKANPEGKFLENVQRFLMKSASGLELLLDVNSQIYAVETGDTFIVQVSKRLVERQVYSPEELALVSDNDFEYIMNGVVFKIEGGEESVTVYASFGGLMLRLKGDLTQLQNFKAEGVDSRVLFLMKRI